MHTLREALTSLWTQLNPKEPSAAFLAVFFGAALILFSIALMIGAR